MSIVPSVCRLPGVGVYQECGASRVPEHPGGFKSGSSTLDCGLGVRRGLTTLHPAQSGPFSQVLRRA